MRRRYEGGTDSRRWLDWLDCAGDDLLAAQLLLHNDQTCNAAAFHCQQCIEKALKCYILFRTRAHVDGHNLTWLCRQAMRHDARFNEWLDESAALNRYYIETRYPSDLPLELSVQQVETLYGMAKRMFEVITTEEEGGARAPHARGEGADTQ